MKIKWGSPLFPVRLHFIPYSCPHAMPMVSIVCGVLWLARMAVLINRHEMR